MMSERSPAAVSPLPRSATNAIRRAARVFPVIVLRGPRQSGKSTVAAAFARDDGRIVESFDDPRTSQAFRDDQDGFVRRGKPMVLDEVQREPGVMLALKRAVDAMGTRRRPGHYLVTGSANLLLMRQVADSLAGRAAYINLWPMTRRERLGRGATGRWSAFFDSVPEEWPRLAEADDAPRDSWRDLVRLGGFPEPALAPTDFPIGQWTSAYIQTYLNRDLRDLAELGSTVDFHRLMQAAVVRLGSLTNQTQLGLDVQLPQTRVRSYLNLLEISFQLVRLQAFVLGRRKRLIKSPKLYWNDPALAMHLGGVSDPTGAHFENLVLIDLLAWRETRTSWPQIGYWRTSAGHEVDFVIEAPQRLLPIEVKTSRSVAPGDLKGMPTFLDEYGKRAPGGLVLYEGDDVRALGRNVFAVPWWRVM